MADNYPQIFVRVSDEEREAIASEAQRSHMPMSTLVRSIVMQEINARRERREMLRQQQIRQLSAVE
jgi:predicted DNA binding CopG/RHH family protein